MATAVFNLRTHAMLAVAVTLALAAISLGSPAGASAGKTYQCQHPVITGQEASHLKNVSPAVACRAVRQLGRFIEGGERRLYKCVGLTASHPGRPVLKIHRLVGWNLRVLRGYEFMMYRGRSSFLVTGTDFPLNCS